MPRTSPRTAALCAWLLPCQVIAAASSASASATRTDTAVSATQAAASAASETPKGTAASATQAAASAAASETPKGTAASATQAAAAAPTGPAPGAASEAPESPFAAQERYTTPRPGPATEPTPAQRRWIRQAPLAGAEPSWGAPGSQMPEYAEIEGPAPAPKGPPPRGTGRIVTGAILGPAGLALTISGIVGASTSLLGEQKRLAVPMIGVGLVTTAIGAALLVDGFLRRKRFLQWEAKGAKVSVRPGVTGAALSLRF